jgi:hypothetical protein
MEGVSELQGGWRAKSAGKAFTGLDGSDAMVASLPQDGGRRARDMASPVDAEERTT